ncbi:MAG: B12-binding domain-containing radical SAM protein [Deltaproteobacteria bacterium]|nr:B12-binding domain-containing radical SAM protein [Deltaproteobacteria bacterium]
MKVILISMPDIAPIVIHEAAIHMPNLGIASVGGNIDEHHDVYIIDLIRKRNQVRKYLTRTLKKIRPELVGLSAMTWQYDTCIKIMRLIKELLPDVKIAIGGYHATVMYEVSYKRGGRFIHNPKRDLLDLSRLKLPIRDKRRLTWGYHVMNNKFEVMETSRGCTRSCNFCSIRNMYGRSFRTFPIEHVLANLDDIYYKRKTRWVLIADDNLVLAPDRVIILCDAIIQKNYKNLNFVIQADCVSMARNEEMVRKLSLAGVKSVFLGIENASPKNLRTAQKGDITKASVKAVANCHKHRIMVIAGLILGFPDDDEASIIQNYEFLNALKIDASWCQILTPYPKTGIRQKLVDEGLVTNLYDYKRYNGLWANVKTKWLEAEQLQYLFWYHKQTVLGWWDPSDLARRDGKLWISIWRFIFKPILHYFTNRTLRKYGWDGRYQREIKRLSNLNTFDDLK